MKYSLFDDKIRFLIIAAIIVFLTLVASQIELPSGIGKSDFRAYWSASYLFARGEDFTDSARLLEVQRQMTGRDRDYPMKTWNPPLVLVLLLPYASMSFDKAAFLWLMTNILALFLSVVVGWNLCRAEDKAHKGIWLPLAAAILFPSTIVALFHGQTNLIVLVGVVGFIALYKKRLDLAAGLVLVLTTIKPHLVYLVVPLVVLEVWRERRWAVLAGLALGIVGLLVTVYGMRPTFFQEYLQSNLEGDLLNWATPTLTTFLSVYLDLGWIRLLGVALLPLSLVWYWFSRQRLELIDVIEITLIVSIITAPFGWSYDFVVLLLPMTRMWSWIAEGVFTRLEAFLFVGVFLMIYVVYTLQRIASPDDLYFFWVPILLGGTYWWMRHRVVRRGQPGIGPAAG